MGLNMILQTLGSLLPNSTRPTCKCGAPAKTWTGAEVSQHGRHHHHHLHHQHHHHHRRHHHHHHHHHHHQGFGSDGKNVSNVPSFSTDSKSNVLCFPALRAEATKVRVFFEWARYRQDNSGVWTNLTVVPTSRSNKHIPEHARWVIKELGYWRLFALAVFNNQKVVELPVSTHSRAARTWQRGVEWGSSQQIWGQWLGDCFGQLWLDESLFSSIWTCLQVCWHFIWVHGT